MKTFKLKLNGLTKEQIVLLKKGKLPFAVFATILGGEAYSEAKKLINDKLAEEDIDVNDNETVEDVIVNEDDSCLYDFEVPTSVEFADNVSNEMTFGEAFEAARAQLGEGGFFMWKGSPYNTYTKEEWESFTDEDKQELFKLFSENTDFDNGNIDDHEPDIDIDANEEDSVELEDIGTDEEIIEGLNDGEAFTEEDNIGEDI